jgi:hypothetical protein
LAVADCEQIGAELVDLVEQPRLRRGGEAQDGDNGGHANGDAEGGERSPKLPGAQSDGGESEQVEDV